MDKSAINNINKDNSTVIVNNEFVKQLNLTSESMTKKTNDNNTNLTSIKLGCLKTIQIFLSELGFALILALIIIIVYAVPQKHSKKIFTSKEKTEFNQDPIILLHTTDIHVNSKKTERNDGLVEFMKSLCEYEPDLVLITGDLVDNYHKKLRLGLQNLDDWNIYNKTIKELFQQKNFNVIEISGNHEQWAVNRATSRENNYLDYSFTFNRNNTKNKLDFLLRKIKININNIDLTFLLFNDYRYPVYRPPYGAETHTTSDQMDLLERAIRYSEEKEIFILSHYPVDRAWLVKSSRGNSFDDIIANEKVYAIFTGHEHPNNVKIIHHGEKGGLEFCTSSAFDKKRAGLITLDNGNLIYHEVYIPNYGTKPLFFITYPIPNEQLSSHHIFNMNTFDIRVIS